MFIDYVTLMLINMVGQLVILAFFLYKGMDSQDKASWAPAFGTAGLVGVICGFMMIFTSPLPKPYSMAFGEMTVLMSILFVAAAWTLAKDWNLLPLGIYAFFAGLAAILLGVQIIHLSLTAVPVLSGAGFIITGLGGVFAGFTLWPREMKVFRIIGALVMLAAAVIWALTAYMAYWQHMLPPKTT